LTVIEHSGSGDDDDERTADREAKGSAFIWLTMALIVMIAIAVLVIIFIRKRNRERDEDEEEKKDHGELMSADLSGRENELVNELVELEDERESVLVRLDRVTGKLEQLDWDLEDGYINRRRYDLLVDKCLHGREKLNDELTEIDDEIEHLELELERDEQRRKSGKRQYGGGGDDDFHQSPYKEAGEQWDDDYDEDWMTDEYWDD